MERIAFFLICFFAATTSLSAQTEMPAPDTLAQKIARRGLIIEGETIICPGSITALKVKGEYAGYLWNTGQRTPNLTVYMPGTYEVTVTTKGGCELTGSVTVRYSDSPCL